MCCSVVQCFAVCCSAMVVTGQSSRAYPCRHSWNISSRLRNWKCVWVCECVNVWVCESPGVQSKITCLYDYVINVCKSLYLSLSLPLCVCVELELHWENSMYSVAHDEVHCTKLKYIAQSIEVHNLSTFKYITFARDTVHLSTDHCTRCSRYKGLFSISTNRSVLNLEQRWHFTCEEMEASGTIRFLDHSYTYVYIYIYIDTYIYRLMASFPLEWRHSLSIFFPSKICALERWHALTLKHMHTLDAFTHTYMHTHTHTHTCTHTHTHINTLQLHIHVYVCINVYIHTDSLSIWYVFFHFFWCRVKSLQSSAAGDWGNFRQLCKILNRIILMYCRE